jgi:hypothetical protein
LEIRRSANLEAGLTLAELLSHYRGRREQAREVYDRLEREVPLEPAVELGLANLCVRDLSAMAIPRKPPSTAR